MMDFITFFPQNISGENVKSWKLNLQLETFFVLNIQYEAAEMQKHCHQNISYIIS